MIGATDGTPAGRYHQRWGLGAGAGTWICQLHNLSPGFRRYVVELYRHARLTRK